MTTKRKLWKRSRPTTALVHRIRTIIREAGYDEELAVTPLHQQLSVLVRKGEDMFNVRIDKETMEIVSTDELGYNRRRANIRRVYRKPV